MKKTIFLLALALSLAILFAAPAAAKTMLVYGPTSGSLYDETTPGFTVTVWTAPMWASATTAMFAAFDVIVFEDYSGIGSCCPDPTIWNTAIANRAVWSAAV